MIAAKGACQSSYKSFASTAETIANYADAGALIAAGAGLALAPTGAGLAVLEITAIGLKGVSFAANAAAFGANLLAGDTRVQYLTPLASMRAVTLERNDSRRAITRSQVAP